MMNRLASLTEAGKVAGSASLRSENRVEQFCTPKVEHLIRQNRRIGKSPDQITSLLTLHDPSDCYKVRSWVDRIFTEPLLTITGCWRVDFDINTSRRNITIPLSAWRDYLTEVGFRRYRMGKQTGFARLENNVAKRIEREEIKRFVDSFILELPFEFYGAEPGLNESPKRYLIWREDLREVVMNQTAILYSEHQLEYLPCLPEKPHRDTAVTTHFYYRNGWLQMTKDKFELRPYHELPGYIWQEQQVTPLRDFKQTFLPKPCTESNFHRFCSRAFGTDYRRTLVLYSNLACLLHDYRCRTKSELVVLSEMLSEKWLKGGVGKGLIIQALATLRKICILDGNDPELLGEFRFSGVSELDRIVVIDGLNQRRNSLEALLPFQQKGLPIRRKYRNEIRLSFEDSPHLLVTSQERLTDDSSEKNSVIELMFTHYFNENHTPWQEIGQSLFQDWDQEQWNHFDTLIMHMMKHWLKGGNKRRMIPTKEESSIKLARTTCPEFVNYLDESLKDTDGTWLAVWHSTDTLYKVFTVLNPAYDHVASNTFALWVQLYATHNGLKFTKKRMLSEKRKLVHIRFEPKSGV